MGIIGYELIVLGFVCLLSKARWLFPVRAKLMFVSFTAGLCFGAVSFWKRERGLAIYLGVFALFWLFLFIFSLFKGGKYQEVIHVPAGSYEVTADDGEGPVIRLRYLLAYEGKVYCLSTTPPSGKPPLTLYVTKRNDSDILLADIVIEKSLESLSMRRILPAIYSILVLLAAVALPVFYKLYENGDSLANLLGSCITVMAGYLTATFAKDGKGLLHRILYWFGIFLEAAGWISALVVIL